MNEGEKANTPRATGGCKLSSTAIKKKGKPNRPSRRYVPSGPTARAPSGPPRRAVTGAATGVE